MSDEAPLDAVHGFAAGALERLFEEARAQWATVPLAFADYRRHVLRHCGSPAEMLNLGPERAAELYLAAACTAGAPNAASEFSRAYGSIIDQAIRRAGASDVELDELRQDVLELLLVPRPTRSAKLAEYGGRGPLAAWLRTVAARRVIRRRDRARTTPAEPLHDVLLAGGDDMELLELRARYGDAFAMAVRDAIGNLSARQRNLLRQHHVDGLTVRQLGTMHGVHSSTVTRWLQDARTQLHDDTLARLRMALGASDSTVQSIVRMVLSDLDLTLRRLLA